VKRYRVIVGSLGAVEVDRFGRPEEAARNLTLRRLRTSCPTRAKPREDPEAKPLYEFEVEVERGQQTDVDIRGSAPSSSQRRRQCGSRCL
jgi:hypothetical protein